MRAANSSFELIGRDGTLQLHVDGAKSPIRYLVDAKSIIILPKMGNMILYRNQTKWGKLGHSIKSEDFLRTDH